MLMCGGTLLTRVLQIIMAKPCRRLQKTVEHALEALLIRTERWGILL